MSYSYKGTRKKPQLNGIITLEYTSETQRKLKWNNCILYKTGTRLDVSLEKASSGLQTNKYKQITGLFVKFAQGNF